MLAAQADQPIAVRADAETRTFKRGQVFLVPPGIAYELSAVGPATVFKATVPSGARAGQELDEPLMFRDRSPAALAFGTSGLRGLVSDITDLEAYQASSLPGILPGGLSWRLHSQFRVQNCHSVRQDGAYLRLVYPSPPSGEERPGV